MLKEELGVATNIGEAYKIGEDKCIIETQQWEDKLKILKEKNKLKGKNVYIDSAMTPNEREIQKILRDFARSESRKGAKVKVKYQKVIINGEAWTWDKKKEKMVGPRDGHASSKN